MTLMYGARGRCTPDQGHGSEWYEQFAHLVRTTPQNAVSIAGRTLPGMGDRPDGWLQLFETVFERSTNPMSLLSDDRVIVRANQAKARLLGLPLEQLVGRRVEDVVAPEHLATAIETFERARQGGSETLGEYDLIRADGTRVHVQYALEPTDVIPEATVICIELSTGAAGELTGSEDAASGIALTRREHEVVQLLALGSTGPDIADELVLSHDTVRTHVRNAMGKAGARTRAQLVAMMMGGRLESR
jgi:PAS domain S-box-containing protein